MSSTRPLNNTSGKKLELLVPEQLSSVSKKTGKSILTWTENSIWYEVYRTWLSVQNGVCVVWTYNQPKKRFYR